MLRKSLLFILSVLVLVLFCAGSALALNVSVLDDNGNVVSIDSVAPGVDGDWDVGITESFTSDQSVWITFAQAAGVVYGDDISVTASITNDSGLIWRDFHLKLYTPSPVVNGSFWEESSNSDGLYFNSLSSSGPFSQTWYDANDIDELWLWDGVWGIGQTFTVSFSVGGWGWDEGSVPLFLLEQWPTDTGGPIPTPEPSTLLLTVIGLAGLALRRRFTA